MNNNTIHDLKSRLSETYVGYNFNILPTNPTKITISVFRNQKNVGAISMEVNIPINEFWSKIHDWMKTVISTNRSFVSF